MRSVRKHIHGLDVDDVVVRSEDGQVTGLSSRIATHIDHPLRSAGKQDLRHVGMDAGPGRVEHHDVGLAVGGDEVRVQDVLHVAGKEFGSS